jgi:hypothetical protein
VEAIDRPSQFGGDTIVNLLELPFPFSQAIVNLMVYSPGGKKACPVFAGITRASGIAIHAPG